MGPLARAAESRGGGFLAANRPLGVVLAGGRGARLGGAKATVELAGRPLIAYPLVALAEAGLDCCVVAKPGSTLPGLEEVSLLAEPERPHHPLCGIVAALRAVPDRDLVVVPCDMPFLVPALLELLAGPSKPPEPPAGVSEPPELQAGPSEPPEPPAGVSEPPELQAGASEPPEPPAGVSKPPELQAGASEPLVVLAREGHVQPLPGRYAAALLPELEVALGHEEPLRHTAESLGARILGEAELRRLGDPARLLFNVNDPADLRRAESMLAN